MDLSRLNKFVKRERYQSATPAQAVADIAGESAKVFTKLDALKGYHQCPLDTDSQLLTTFITPFGRFKFLCAPYGISSISEHYSLDTVVLWMTSSSMTAVRETTLNMFASF